MTDPELSASLFLDHVKAGIERLDDAALSEPDRVEAMRLAWLLARIAKRGTV